MKFGYSLLNKKGRYIKMENTKVQTLEKVNWQSITWFTGLMAVAIVLPRFIHNQFVTGPIVNATLFLAAYYLGNGPAILVGLVPSVTALSAGLLPMPLAPMVPFIMISNAILIISFNWLRKMNFGIAAIVSSLAKYVFLYATAILVISKIMPQTLATKASLVMMAWPQLVTAGVGALIAFGIIKVIKRGENE
jgi:hypothetical protein